MGRYIKQPKIFYFIYGELGYFGPYLKKPDGYTNIKNLN
jgi:hypothetical protein